MTTTRLHQLVVNPLDPDVRQALHDPYDMHRSLLAAFSDSLPTEQSKSAQRDVGLTWRLEHHRAAGRHILVMESADVVPDWAVLPGGYSLFPTETKDLSSLLGQVRNEASIRFRVVTEPTVATPTGRGVRGKRRPLLEAVARAEWLMRQFAQGGLTITDVVERPQPKVVAKGGTVRFSPGMFDGTATVVNAASARDLVRHGLGRGKAFGLGMLTIRV